MERLYPASMRETIRQVLRTKYQLSSSEVDIVHAWGAYYMETHQDLIPPEFEKQLEKFIDWLKTWGR